MKRTFVPYIFLSFLSLGLSSCANKEKEAAVKVLVDTANDALFHGNIVQAENILRNLQTLDSGNENVGSLESLIKEAKDKASVSTSAEGISLSSTDPCANVSADPLEARKQLQVLGGAYGSYSFEKFYGAVYEGDTLATCLYLASGMDVNATAHHAGSALVAAAKNNQLEMVKLLLARKADPNLTIAPDATVAWQNVRNAAGFSALMFAVNSGNLAIVKMLLEAGADPNAISKDGTTALALAERMQRPDLIDAVKHYQSGIHSGQPAVAREARR